MWYATEGGLERYDGYQFTIYKHDPNDSRTLSDNLVQKSPRTAREICGLEQDWDWTDLIPKQTRFYTTRRIWQVQQCSKVNPSRSFNFAQDFSGLGQMEAGSQR
jgi:hypothetical protein